MRQTPQATRKRLLGHLESTNGLPVGVRVRGWAERPVQANLDAAPPAARGGGTVSERASELTLAEVMADFEPGDRCAQEYQALLAERDRLHRHWLSSVTVEWHQREMAAAEAEHARLKAAPSVLAAEIRDSRIANAKALEQAEAGREGER